MKTEGLPPLPEKFIYRLDLREHVTPRLLKSEPIHRWFWFPHSFSPQLLDEVLKVYPLPDGAKILDPFVGAGTTVLRAKQLGFSATGCDLSPLSIFVSRTKLQSYAPERIEVGLQRLSLMDEVPPNWKAVLRQHLQTWESTERLRRAFTLKEWQTLASIYEWIQSQLMGHLEKELFLLAWLNVQQRISRAIPDGGWFRWVDKQDQSNEVLNFLLKEMSMFLTEIQMIRPTSNTQWELHQLDSRDLTTLEDRFDLILTSPPYPNRHDYSRVFHLALLGLGFSEAEVFKLRYQSIRSHVEARSPETKITFDISQHPNLQRSLNEFPDDIDPRIPTMIIGYFQDMDLCLRHAHHVLKEGGIFALVVGNVRHAGVMVPVDEVLAGIGMSAGFFLESAWVARLRGNSAQQMARFGRVPARETILVFRKDENSF